MTRPSRLVALAVGAALLLGACGGGDDRPSVAQNRGEPAATAATTTLPPNTSLVATATVPEVQVYDSPDAPAPARGFENPWHLNNDPKLAVPLVFLVTQRQDKWLQVLLPERPNGSTAWLHASDVRVTPNPYRIAVELGAHRITVYNGEAVVLQEPVAIGTADTPTPTGTYYLRVLLKAPDPNTVYGPYAYGLSGHSDVLTSFNGGDGEIGIHGNNDSSVLGTSVTHGCIRMSNDGITRLTGILPLGTKVEVTA
jgi:lipoprotein-anchoring transpeptidase ErfK/SrfK